jgi:hypothetical protein
MTMLTRGSLEPVIAHLVFNRKRLAAGEQDPASILVRINI